MGRFIDLAGQTFGKWTVLERVDNRGKKTYWKCECECGKVVDVVADSLRSGKSVSCGCYRAEENKKRFTKHGSCATRLYKIYAHMKSRCYNKNDEKFYRYGGRGITVCVEWLNDFNSFKNWALENGYEPNLTIDRINNNGIYCPYNCRWANYQTQGQNKKGVVLTPDLVRQYRTEYELVKNTVSKAEFARQKGVYKETMLKMLNKETWKNV